jgi:hypothetical protein
MSATEKINNLTSGETDKNLKTDEIQRNETRPSNFLYTESMKNATDKINKLTLEEINKDLKNTLFSTDKLNVLITGEELNLVNQETIRENVTGIFNDVLQECERREKNEKEMLRKHPKSSTFFLEKIQNKKEVCQQYIDKCADDPDFPLRWYKELKEKILDERLDYYRYLYQLSENFTNIYGGEISEQDVQELISRILIYPSYTFNIFANEEARNHNEINQHIRLEGYNVKRKNIENFDKKTPVIVKMDFYPDLEVENNNLILVTNERNKEVVVHESIHNLAKEKREILNIEGKNIYSITQGFVRTYFDESGEKITLFDNPELDSALPDNMRFLDEAAVMLLEQVVVSGEKSEAALDKISKRFEEPFSMYDYKNAKHFREMVEVAKIIGVEKIAKSHINSNVDQLLNTIRDAKGESYLKSFLEKIKSGGIEYYFD